MSPRQLSSIYGTDDTGAAQSIADAALDTSGMGASNINQSDNWGATAADDRAFAKGNTPEYEDYKPRILRGLEAGGGDGENLLHPYPQSQRLPRHVPGPRTSTDEGGGVTDPPPARQTGTSAGKYPAYKG